MVLAQDMAQANQSKNVLAARQYQKDMTQYNQDMVKWEKEKTEYDAKQKAIADKKAAKAIALKAEYKAVEDKYSATIAANPYAVTTGKGRASWYSSQPRQVWVAQATKARAYAKASIGIREYGLKTYSVRLGRSASRALNNPNISTRGGSMHTQFQIGIALTNRALYSGNLAPKDYAARIAGIRQTYQEAQQRFTINTARTAATTLRSQKIQRDTARAIAAGSGGAIGSISSSGVASVSTGSQVKTIDIKDLRPSRPVAPNAPSSMLQRGERITVTTPDGKERTFKDRATADKFVSRLEGSYVKPTQPKGIGSTATTSMLLGGASLIGSSYVGYAPDGKPYQGAAQPTGYVVDYGGKERVFLNLSSAEKFIDRLPEYKTGFSSAVGSIGKSVKDTPLETFGKELESTARYGDRVDLGEEPRPISILDLTGYYASQALKPILDIGYQAKNLLTGDEKPIAPSLPSIVFEQGFEVAKKIWETGDLTPEVEDKIGEFIAKDPLRSAVQLPAEAALWITGGKAIGLGIKAAGKVASKYGITSPITKISGGLEGETLYKGIAIKQKPVIGIQQGKIVLGKPKPVTPKLSESTLTDRSKGELAFGGGAERSLFYTEKGLQKQVEAGLINPLSKERSLATARLEDATQAVKAKETTSEIGAAAFKNVTEKQGEALLKTTEKLQKELDLLHGSAAARASIEPSVKVQSGDILMMRDLDVVPRGLTKKETSIASKLTKEEKTQGITKETKIEAREKELGIKIGKVYEKDFPLEAGETKVLKIPKGSGNIGLEITGVGGKKSKVMEVVLKKSEETVGKDKGTYILGYKIPFGESKTAKDFKIKTHSLKFQALTQTKTALDYQKYSLTAGQITKKGYKPTKEFSKLDTPAEAKIYPAAGREKDIPRRYWEARQVELDQIRTGRVTAAKETRAAAEGYKKLYPELDFKVLPAEKIAISFGSKPVESAPSKILISPTIGGGVRLEPQPKQTARSEITDRQEIKPRELSSTKITPSKKLESSRMSFDSSSKIEPISLRDVSSIINSKGSSIKPRPTASSILKSISSKKPIRTKSKIPVSPAPSLDIPSRPSVPSSPSSTPSPSLRPSKPSRLARITITLPVIQREKKKPVAAIPIALRNTEYERKKKEKGQKDFLGNTRTDSFVGLINRKEILVGDKLTAKQIKLDKKLVLNPKKKGLSSVRKQKRTAAFAKSKGFRF